MTTPRDECEECEATAAEVRALGHRPGCRHEVLQTGGAQPLSVSFQSFDTPEGGVSMDLGVIESPDPLAHLRVLLDAKLAPKVTPTGGHLAGCTCEIVAVWHDEVCPVELRAPDGTLHRYAIDALFGAKEDAPAQEVVAEPEDSTDSTQWVVAELLSGLAAPRVTNMTFATSGGAARAPICAIVAELLRLGHPVTAWMGEARVRVEEVVDVQSTAMVVVDGAGVRHPVKVTDLTSPKINGWLRIGEVDFCVWRKDVTP